MLALVNGDYAATGERAGDSDAGTRQFCSGS